MTTFVRAVNHPRGLDDPRRGVLQRPQGHRRRAHPAHRRGVNVQMLLNDNWTSLPDQADPASSARTSRKAQLPADLQELVPGQAGQPALEVLPVHAHRHGAYMTMMGSANLTGNGVKIQWNDMYTVNNHKQMYDEYCRVFNQMKRDRPMKHPFRAGTVRGAYGMNFYPRYRHQREQRPDHEAAATRSAATEPGRDRHRRQDDDPDLDVRLERRARAATSPTRSRRCPGTAATSG